jgi:hypothetical protein
VRDEYSNGGMILTGKTEELGENLSTTDPTGTDPVEKPGLSAEKPSPNHLCHGKLYKGFIPRPI